MSIKQKFPYLVLVIQFDEEGKYIGKEEARYTKKESFLKLASGDWVLDKLFGDNESDIPSWILTNKQFFFSKDSLSVVKATVLATYKRFGVEHNQSK